MELIAVVFDLGGVLARIWHTWQGAALEAGVPIRLDPAAPIPLIDFLPLDEYQMGGLSEAGYLVALGDWLGCSVEDALSIHNHILIGEYPGTEALVDDIEQAGFVTGCLSNTNAAHWAELAGPRFPAISRLDRKMASHIVGLNKPDPAIFRLYASVNGLQPEEIVYFDDHFGNVESAKSVGFRAFRVDPHSDTVAFMRKTLTECGIQLLK